MEGKILGFYVAIFIVLFSSLTVVAAQSATSSSLVVSPSGLVLVGKEGDENVTGNLSFVGTANETIEVRLFASDLIDNSSGKMISSSQLALTSVQFSVSRYQQENIGVTVNTHGFGIGTYKGTILVVANPVNANSSVMNIGVSVRIDTAKSIFGSSFQSLLIILIIVLSIVGYLYGENGPKYNTQAVILVSIAIGSIWVYTIINFTFSDLNTVISTVLIAPFLTYSASFLNEKRSERNSKDTASAAILKDGTKDDVELIRNIMGELVTHYASFDPYRYSKNDFQEEQETPPLNKKVNNETKINGENEIFTPLILFHKSGVLNREVWDKSCKQGRVADLPILRLEKYYDFIQLYNRYYSCAIMKTAEKTEKQFKDMATEPFFVQFKTFRKAYRDLENVLFANLSYDIGLFTRNNLSPLDTQPRITRPLIEKLIDYNVLDPTHFFKDLKDEKKLGEEFKSIFPKEPETSEKLKEFMKKKAKDRIKDWKISAKDLKQISKEIYGKEKIPLFYYEVENDFKQKYELLLKAIGELLSDAPLPQEFVESEKDTTFLQEHSILNLLEELDKLKKLLDEELITADEFEGWKKKILEKTSILKDKPHALSPLRELQSRGSRYETERILKRNKVNTTKS